MVRLVEWAEFKDEKQWGTMQADTTMLGIHRVFCINLWLAHLQNAAQCAACVGPGSALAAAPTGRQRCAASKLSVGSATLRGCFIQLKTTMKQ